MDVAAAEHIRHRLLDLLGSLPVFRTGTVHTWISELPPIEKFKAKNGAERVAATMGIDAKLRESGRFAGRVKMSKRGNRYLRRAILLAARTAARSPEKAL